MIKIFKKDIKLFFKDKKSVLLTFMLPIVLITLFALAFGGVGSTETKSRPIKLLVSDLDKTETSTSAIANLDTLKNIIITKLPFEEAKKQVIKGKYVAVLAFYKGFQDSIESAKSMPVELFYDRAREMEVGLLQSYLIRHLMGSVGKKTISTGIKSYITKEFPEVTDSMLDKIISDIDFDSGEKKNSTGEKKVRPFGNMEVKTTSLVGEEKNKNLGLIQAVAGTSIMMLLFSVAGLGSGMLEEKENGTLKRLLFSPVNPNSILFGKMLSSYLIAVLQLTAMFIFAWLAFDLDLFINLPALILMITTTAFAVSSLGIFLAAISKTRAQANNMSTIIILTMSAIGGSMVPLFLLPSFMKKIAVISVNYWGVNGFFDIYWRNLPTIEILPKAVVLLGIGIFVSLISIHFFRKNILKLI
ncbi:MAG: ABC transporter permease [Rhodothermaceae bacterium]